VSARVGDLAAYLRRIPGLQRDAILYLLAAVFALVNAFVAESADYREWGAIALGGYLCAAIASVVVLVRRRHLDRDATKSAERSQPGEQSRARAATRQDGGAAGWTILALVIVATVIVPLMLEVIWRAEAAPGAHAQPEVAVIERAGDRLAHHKDPYPRHPRTVGIAPSSDARDVDNNSFFPYLPGMVPFGMINAISGPPELTDARVPLTGFTFLVTAVALLLAAAPLERKRLSLQVLIALPTGALPIVTGGDDLPVLALMLLALVLAQRHRVVLSGLVAGIAATLKFTAWPVVFLLVFATSDRRGRRSPLAYALAVAIIAVPVLGIGFALDPSAFILNTIRFPLGLTRVVSPAGSPLPGEILVRLFPHAKKELTAGLVAVGVAAVTIGFIRYRPTTPSGVAYFSGLALLLALLLAPATRFGYLIYPANLLAWGYMLSVSQTERKAGQMTVAPSRAGELEAAEQPAGLLPAAQRAVAERQATPRPAH